jgi:hypothetical protein
MANFPVLKTGAVAQYPSDRWLETGTLVHEFVDGSEQRSALYGSPVRRWQIRLDLLDEAEMFRLEEFFAEQGGEAGEFVFTDPWDGMEYPRCSFESGVMELNFEGPGRGTLELIVRENR